MISNLVLSYILKSLNAIVNVFVTLLVLKWSTFCSMIGVPKVVMLTPIWSTPHSMTVVSKVADIVPLYGVLLII